MLFNQEQFEAEQENTNTRRKSFIDSLSEEERQQFKIVEEVVKKLVDNKIMFFLFPYLPHPQNKNKYGAWQWNSLGALMQYESPDKPTKEYDEKVNDANRSMIATVYNSIMESINFRHLSAQDKFQKYGQLLFEAMTEENNKYNE